MKSNKIKRREKVECAIAKEQRRQIAYQNSLAYKKDLETYQQQKFIETMKKARSVNKNPISIINALKNKEELYLSGNTRFRSYQELFYFFYEEDFRECLTKSLMHFENLNVHFNEQHNKDFFNGIKGIILFKDSWIRPLEDWKSPCHNTRRQFSSLLRHLFAKYPVPLFMDKGFYNGSDKEMKWFLHVGLGNNIRTAKDLPIPLTKKSAHYMMEAPNDYDPLSALRWGQVKSLGGNERCIRAILKTRLQYHFGFNEFWESVFRWFIDNPMLDTNLYAPLVDYFYNQRFVCPANGNIPQPNLSMSKRNVESTVNQMQEWHRQTTRVNHKVPNYWKPSGIPGFDYVEGEGNKRSYVIKELLTSSELRAEGNSMHHCVGSYAYSCAKGAISIWSLQETTPGHTMNLLTIEVNNASRTIQQARGKFNADPLMKARNVMNRWAAKAKLSISKWII